MRVSLDGTSNLIIFSNFHFFSPAWVTRLGVTANVRNFKLLVRTVHTDTYHPWKNEGLAMSSVAILNCQIWVQYRPDFRICGSNCHIPGGSMFQSYLSEYSILEVETFRRYSHLIEPSA